MLAALVRGDPNGVADLGCTAWPHSAQKITEGDGRSCPHSEQNFGINLNVPQFASIPHQHLHCRSRKMTDKVNFGKVKAAHAIAAAYVIAELSKHLQRAPVLATCFHAPTTPAVRLPSLESSGHSRRATTCVNSVRSWKCHDVG